MGAEGLSVIKITNHETVQNVQFHDGVMPYTTIVDSVIDDTRTHQDTHDATLENFFNRPIVISEQEWSVGANLFYQFDPWSLYFENPRVSNRIANFNLLRCRLCLKFIINGNGFLYSRALASYLPNVLFDTLSQNRSGTPNDMVQASQQPHIFLNPTTSSAGNMCLPFFAPANNVFIPGANWDRLGQVTVRSFQPLAHANGGTTDVTITVLAWAEDVQLSVLTTVESSTLSPQMGKEIDDANKTGMISGPATAVSRFAKALAKAPPLAPYAMATAMTADAVAAVAKLFGYSRPPVTKNPEPYRPTAISSMALTTVPDTSMKLTVDDKQELSIDPRIAGLDSHDPMSIKSIACRESYLTQFSWNVGTAPNTLLWNGRVSPVTWAQNGSEYHFPACAMAALPFTYWTGTIIFRFQVMCSAFHKGRLKITFDPNWIATDEYNTNYIQLVDIAEETDFSIAITNGQDLTFLNHHLPGIDSVTQVYSTTRYTSKEEGNGVIGVTVQNELTVPNSAVSTDVNVNVFVSAGDDFEVAVPNSHFASFVYKSQMGTEFSSQSGEEEINPNAMADSELDKPEDKSPEQIIHTYDSLQNVHKVFFGETIKSFRPLLHRYNLHTTVGALTNAFRTIGIRMAMYPYLRGNVASAIHTTDLAAPYNFCNTVLIHWVTNCFSAWRGSIRYKVVTRGNLTLTTANYVMRASRLDYPSGLNQYDYNATNFPGPTNESQAGHGSIYEPLNPRVPPFGHNGTSYSIDKVNPTHEWEVPYYSHFRFCPGKLEDLTGPVTLEETAIQCHRLDLIFNGASTSAFDIYCATGEDYQVYFFTGCPPMYYEAAPPDPAP